MVADKRLTDTYTNQQQFLTSQEDSLHFWPVKKLVGSFIFHLFRGKQIQSVQRSFIDMWAFREQFLSSSNTVPVQKRLSDWDTSFVTDLADSISPEVSVKLQ